jgi:hypothetical protein
VPRIIGQTPRKGPGPGPAEKQWDEASFFEELRQRRGEEQAEAARSILSWAKRSVPRIWWGKGSKDGSFYPMLDHQGEKHFVVSVWTYGRAEILFERMKTRKPFADEAKRSELRELLNGVPGVEIPADSIDRRPTIPLAVLTDDVALKSFLGVLDWYIAEVRKA